MKIVIAGGTGFLGAPLAEMYAEDGHDVRVLTRSLSPARRATIRAPACPASRASAGSPTAASGPWAGSLEGADAVINLVGRIARRRSAGRRRRRSGLRDSRILATRSLATAIRAAQSPPAVLISGSAVGYYGPSDDQTAHRARSAGHRFPRAAVRRLGTGSAQGRAPGHARRAAAHGRRARAIGRRAAGDDAAVQVLRRRTDRIGPAVRLVDPSPRLDRDRALDRADAERQRPGERDRAAPGHQPPSRARARPRDASPEPRARARLRGEDRRSASSPSTVLTGQRVLPARAQKQGYHFRYPEIEQAFRGIFGD